jgi:hypothetical protein
MLFMKKHQWIFLFIIPLILIFSNLNEAGGKSKSTGGTLIGSWQCQGKSGASSLIFESQSRLVFNGDAANYRLVHNAIRVQQDDDPIDYPYFFKGNTLLVTFPNGSRIQCRKTITPQSGSGKKDVSGNNETDGSKTGAGNEWQLRGMLCNWGGSSSSTSSYSRSTRVSFDGRGIFRSSSESSFSSGSGSTYSGDRNPANSGTYRVVGNKVSLTFSNGSTGIAQVHMRQSSGVITELMYGGKLYATGLCD